MEQGWMSLAILTTTNRHLQGTKRAKKRNRPCMEYREHTHSMK